MARRVSWSPEARADVRRLDKATAMRVLTGLNRYLQTEHGDVKQLQQINPPEFRLRLGDYRVRFLLQGNVVRVLAVKHRAEAYR